MQYGFARVIDPNNNLPKFVLVGWAGEGIPERVKGYFNGHFATISKYFHGYHVQITARSQDDLDVRSILSKVERASGAKYSAGLNSSTVRTRPTYSVSSSGANDDDWGDDAPPVVESEVTKVPSSYRPTKVDIAAIKSSAPKSSQFAATPAEPVKGSYQPVGKVDIAAIRAQAKDDRFNPKPSALQSSYKPVGKVDIAALKAQAGKKPSSYTSEPKPSAPAPSQNDDDEDSVPKSFQDRMKAFGGNAAASGLDDEDETPKSLKDRLNKYEHNAERITSLPKPKVHNKVAGRFGAASSSSGTVPPLPVNSFSDSKKTVVGASRDFGSQGGKTPAQIWAEKHAKKTGTTPNASSSPKPESVDATETPSVSSLRSSFGSTAISQPSDEEPSSFNKQEEEEEEEESAPHVSDLKSRFAQKFASSTPSRSPEPVPVRKASPSLRKKVLLRFPLDLYHLLYLPPSVLCLLLCLLLRDPFLFLSQPKLPLNSLLLPLDRSLLRSSLPLVLLRSKSKRRKKRKRRKKKLLLLKLLLPLFLLAVSLSPALLKVLVMVLLLKLLLFSTTPRMMTMSLP